MSLNKGKIFEDKFKQDWKNCFPNTFILRLYDTTNGFTGIANPCDFLCMPSSKLFLIECKSHDGGSIPFSAMPQYERLLEYKDCPNVVGGFIIWFKEKDKVIWCDIWTADKIYKDGHKSIQLSMLTKGTYNLVELPSVKKRVYMETDYTILTSLYEGVKE